MFDRSRTKHCGSSIRRSLEAFEADPGSWIDPRSVYVHVPFCRRICPYCDFAVTRIDRPPASVESYLTSLAVEVARVPRGTALKTLYIGGGTPSALATGSLTRIRDIIASRFDLSKLREFTVECNPEDVSDSLVDEFRALRVDRVSLGVQSGDSFYLRLLGRRHDRSTCLRAVERVRSAGVRHVSLDLIFCLPGQTGESLDRDISWIADADADHVSCYSLAFEPGTPFHTQLLRGTLAALSDDDQLALFRRVHTRLSALGFERYEVSNYARPGHQCLHNRVYWARLPYLGFGPSAASFVGGERTRNARSVFRWQELLAADADVTEEREVLTPYQAFLETMMLGLRTPRGLTWGRLRARFGEGLPHLDRARLSDHVANGTVVSTPFRLQPTSRGLETADYIAQDLVSSRALADR